MVIAEIIDIKKLVFPWEASTWNGNSEARRVSCMTLQERNEAETETGIDRGPHLARLFSYAHLLLPI